MQQEKAVVDEIIEIEAPEVVVIPPLRAIRKHCLWCSNGQAKEVRLCPAKGCVLSPYRFGHRPEEKPELTPLKSIRAKCLDCSCYSPGMVKSCQFVNCVLHPYRMGRNPNLKGKRKGIPEGLKKWHQDQTLR